MSTIQNRESDIQESLDIAQQHRSDSKGNMERFCLERACNGIIRIGVDSFSSPREGIEYIKSKEFGIILKRTIYLNNEIYKQFKIKRDHPRTEVTTDIDLVHFAWLMSMYEDADTMANIACDEEVWKYYPVTRIWKDYHRVIYGFISGAPYNPKPPKLKGYEKHWEPYLYLMNSILEGSNVEEAISKVDSSFHKRNRDKRLQNYPSFDGEGNYPVNWDLRKETILSYAAYRKY